VTPKSFSEFEVEKRPVFALAEFRTLRACCGLTCSPLDEREINLGERERKSKSLKLNLFSSECDCRKNEVIFLNRQNTGFYEVTCTLNNSNYTVKVAGLDGLVCGVYETLRRRSETDKRPVRRCIHE